LGKGHEVGGGGDDAKKKVSDCGEGIERKGTNPVRATKKRNRRNIYQGKHVVVKSKTEWNKNCQGEQRQERGNKTSFKKVGVVTFGED